jgi:hypothetical protein
LPPYAATANGRIDPHAFDLSSDLIQSAHTSTADRTTLEVCDKKRPDRGFELRRRGRDRLFGIEPFGEPGGELREIPPEQLRRQLAVGWFTDNADLGCLHDEEYAGLTA